MFSKQSVATLYHVTSLSKLPTILTEGLIPQVGPRSQKLNEQPGVFLFKSLEDLEDALMNWLGEELEDDEDDVSILEVTLPMDFPLETPVEWERVSRRTIPPQHIHILDQGGTVMSLRQEIEETAIEMNVQDFTEEDVDNVEDIVKRNTDPCQSTEDRISSALFYHNLFYKKGE